MEQLPFVFVSVNAFKSSLFDFVRLIKLLLCYSIFCSTASILCPELQIPENGLIEYVSQLQPLFEFGSTATYSCVEGFGLNGGDSLRVCGPDGNGDDVGKWSGTGPSCNRKLARNLLC